MADFTSSAVRKRQSLRRLGLIALLILAFILRVWNLDWDEGTHQHPDERYWSMVTSDISWEDPVTYFDTGKSKLNPYQYQDTWVYGTLPLFATKAAAEFFEADFFLVDGIVSVVDSVGINLLEDRVSLTGESFSTKTFNSGYEVQNIGRLLAALIDTGTVLLTYLLGRALFTRAAGFTASTLLTFTPLHIQYSHFHGAEPWLTFFTTAAVLFSVLFYKRSERLSSKVFAHNTGALRHAIVIGLFCGLAASSKFTGLMVLISPVVAFALKIFLKPPYSSDDRKRVAKGVASLLTLISVTGLTAVFTFRVFQPYAFSGFLKLSPEFIGDLNYLRSVSEGGDFPWIIQWVDRIPLIDPLRSMFWSGMGPGIGICVLIGMCFIYQSIIRQRDFALLIPLSFVITLGALVTQQFNPLNRYYLPIYPILIVFGGFGIQRLWTGALFRFRSHTNVKVAWGLVLLGCGLIMSMSVLWGIGFVKGVYQSTNPRISATDWVYENIPSGSKISRQIWDDTVPIRSQSQARDEYEYINFDLFRSDSSIDPISGLTKPELLLSQLDEVDYIIESSNRLYDSIPRMPAEYPSTVAYYQSLFSGELGFEKIASFENKPSLFGITFPSDGLEETFSVYDHPTVTIWEKSNEWNIEKARKILNPFASANAPNLMPKEGNQNALMLQPEQYSSLQTGETFDQRFSSSIFKDSLGWLWWFIWLQLSAIVIFPLAIRLFWFLPDRGYSISKVFGFLATGTLTWVLVSWNLIRFSSFACLLSLLMLGAMSFWQATKNWQTIKRFFKSQKRTWITIELVFTGIFFTVLLLRFMNPDLWDAYRGGEKPMELGYLTAIGRSESLPAYDPWFSGGVMNYYYFGWFLLAVPMVGLGLRPEITFQLGLATYVSLAFLGVLAVVVNLAASRRKDLTEVAVSSRALKSGILASLFFGIFGTFDAVRRYHEQFREINQWNFLNEWPIIGALSEFLGGFVAWTRGEPLASFDWWGPSRVNSGNIDITEFPFFTFLFGDLHPHLMGMPVFTLLICMSVAFIFTCRQGKFMRSSIIGVMLGLILAISKMTNTWDIPALFIFALVALSIGAIGYRTGPPSSQSDKQLIECLFWLIAGLSVGFSAIGVGFKWIVALSVLVTLASGIGVFVSYNTQLRILVFIRHLVILNTSYLILLIPYDQARQTFDLSLSRTKWVSPFSDFLSHWGLFLLVAGVFFFVVFLDRKAGGAWIKKPLFQIPRDRSHVGAYAAGVVSSMVTIFSGVIIGWAFAVSVLGFLASLYYLIAEVRGAKSIQKIGALCFWMFGFAILAGPEVVVVSNDVGRMNTVFKFWLQSWTFFAMGSALSIQFIWRYAHKVAERDRSVRAYSYSGLWVISITAVVLIGLIYPFSSVGPRLDQRFSTDVKTLDGISYLSSQPAFARYDNGLDEEPVVVRLGEDLPLIDWIRSSVDGTPTIVEWTGDSYDWNSRIAVHTGLPTVLGWSSHQRQQRMGYQNMISKRKVDIQDFYTSKNHDYMTTFLLTYDVSYIVVGVQERRFVSSDALNYLDQHPGIEVAFKRWDNKIYRVNKSILWELTQASS